MKCILYEKPSVNKFEVEPLDHMTEDEDETIAVEKSEENGKVSGEYEAGESINIGAPASTQLKDRLGAEKIG